MKMYMTTVELRASIFEHLNALLDDEDALIQLRDFLCELQRQKKTPCCYSTEEMKSQLRLRESDAVSGIGLSMEEVELKTNAWE